MVTMDLGTCDGEASGVAAALVEVKMPSGRTVRLCSHHWERSADKLIADGAEIVQDNRQEALYSRA